MVVNYIFNNLQGKMKFKSNINKKKIQNIDELTVEKQNIWIRI
jgi:hypothetical protein